MSGKKASHGHPEEPQSYREASGVIDRILAEIESDTELDVDDLADRVERASKLIDFCFERLRRADLRVRKVAEDLSRTTLAAESADEPTTRVIGTEQEDDPRS
ncbi:MAG: exodeoxyribonuclease VII small subunit [Planctomycetota bacterium]